MPFFEDDYYANEDNPVDNSFQYEFRNREGVYATLFYELSDGKWNATMRVDPAVSGTQEFFEVPVKIVDEMVSQIAVKDLPPQLQPAAAGGLKTFTFDYILTERTKRRTHIEAESLEQARYSLEEYEIDTSDDEDLYSLEWTISNIEEVTEE